MSDREPIRETVIKALNLPAEEKRMFIDFAKCLIENGSDQERVRRVLADCKRIGRPSPIIEGMLVEH